MTSDAIGIVEQIEQQKWDAAARYAVGPADGGCMDGTVVASSRPMLQSFHGVGIGGILIVVNERPWAVNYDAEADSNDGRWWHGRQIGKVGPVDAPTRLVIFST